MFKDTWYMHNNKVITDPKTIADGFNNYFVNIGPTLASKIPDNNVSHRQFLSDSIKPSLFLKPTNETEIKQVISCLKEGAPGRDGLSSKNIKCIKDIYTRSATQKLFYITFRGTTRGQKTFTYCGPRVWNFLISV